MKKALFSLVVFSAIFAVSIAGAQTKKTKKTGSSAASQGQTLDDVHLFQSFLRDAAIANTMYGEGGLQYQSFDGGSIFSFGAQGGYPVSPLIEVNAGIGFLSYSADKADGSSGISDLAVAGRYNLMQGKTMVSAGGLVTLPIGEEKVGQGNLNFGGFGALRYPLDNGMVITGTAGLDFYETKEITYEAPTFNGTTFSGGGFKEETKYKTSFVLGGGVIYPTNDQLNLVGEFTLKTEVDYMLLSGGADYKLESGSRLRGALGIGLDDGAPDFLIMGSFLHSF